MIKQYFIFLCLFLFYEVGMAQGFEVKNFTAEITLDKNGYFDVVENYDINFTENKHGIYRNIITKYDFADADGKITKRKIKISNIDVIGHDFSKTSETETKLSGLLKLKIGSPDYTVFGEQHYEIKYRVEDALIVDDSIVQFYWNIKSSEWEATFDKLNFTIHTPDGSTLSAENCFTYSGAYGITTPSTDFKYQYDSNTYTAQSNPNWQSNFGENVTVLIKIPKSYFVRTSSPFFSIKDFTWMGLLMAILGLFSFSWLKFGKDDEVVSVTSYYPPQGIDAAMAGYLINDKEDTTDLIALFPKWGSEGLLYIEDIPKTGIFGSRDTRLTKLGNIPESAPDYEKTIFEELFDNKENISLDILKTLVNKGGIFSNLSTFINKAETENTSNDIGKTVLMSSLKNKFYTTMDRAKKQLSNNAKIYYEEKGEKAKNTAVILAVLMLFFLTPVFFIYFGILAGIVCLVLSIILIIFSSYMRKKNTSGTKILGELKGFRQFIKLAEQDRIKTLIQEDPHYFEKTMSYALAFGMLEKWGDKFNGLDVQPPTWYSSPTAMSGNFGMRSFTQSFTGNMSSTQNAMVSMPSSSGSSSGGGSFGGGSSGGGFGGGGGGSW